MKQKFELKKLSSVCDIVSDSPKEFIGLKNYYSTGAINNEGDNIVPEEVSFLNRPSRANSYPTLNDIGFAKMKFTNKVIFVNSFFDGSIFSTGFCFLRPKNSLNSRYLFHFVISHLFQNIKDLYAGDGIMGGIKNSDVKEIEIPLPTLPEQQRIVAILDETFTAIAKAKTNAEANLKNAKELFENYLQRVFENGNWEMKELADICEISSKLIDPRKPEFQNLIHIGAGNIESKKGTLLDLKTAKEENLISGKFLFDESMILYSKIRPYLMKVVNCEFKGLCSADIYPLVPVKGKLTKDFLYHLLLTKDFTDYAILGSQRAGMPKVNREHLFAYKLKLPSIKEQQIIVQKLEALSNETKKLEAIYQQKINDLEELKKSVLQKAFSGELKTNAVEV